MNNKKLFRSTTNRMVCGVCGGLGDFFDRCDSDPHFICTCQPVFRCRLFGLILYFILAVIIPEDDGIVD